MNTENSRQTSSGGRLIMDDTVDSVKLKFPMNELTMCMKHTGKQYILSEGPHRVCEIVCIPEEHQV